MIPITAAIVGGGEVQAGEARPRLRPLLLSLTYVIGLALVYAALGLVAGLSGTMFGRISTNPWLYFAMANLLCSPSPYRRHPGPLPFRRAARRDGRGRVEGPGDGGMSGLVAPAPR
jgi:thiol:disulfide interchange protein DsbD